MFIGRKMHETIVKAKENEITELRNKVISLTENVARNNEEIDFLRNLTKRYINYIIETSNQKVENQELKYKNKELKEFKTKVTEIMKRKDSVVGKYDKIKELVDNLETDN